MPPFTIFDLLLEVLIEVIGQILFEVVLNLIFEAMHKLEPSGKTLVFSFWAFVGFVVGVLSALAVPHHVLMWKVAPAITVFGSLVVGGTCLHWYGKWRRQRGHSPSSLASFLGGAAFALGYSIARYLILR